MASTEYVLCYAGVPDCWRVKPEDLPAPPELKSIAACDWPDGAAFSFRDEPGEHAPCYVVMPGGAMLAFNHHAGEGVDIARAKFIANACNRALPIASDVATYYSEGKDADWFEALSDADFVERLHRVAMDLVDGDIGTLESWMPIVAIVGLAADRLAQANAQTSPPVDNRWMDELDAARAGNSWMAPMVGALPRHPSNEITVEKVGNDGSVTLHWHKNRVQAAFMTVRDDANFTQLLCFTTARPAFAPAGLDVDTRLAALPADRDRRMGHETQTLADFTARMRRHQKEWADHEKTVEVTFSPKELGYIADAMEAQAQGEPVAWPQPIATAPKDGTDIIGYQDGEVYRCHWREDEPDEGPGLTGWYDYQNQSFEGPTEWQPLRHAAPPAPSDAGMRERTDALIDSNYLAGLKLGFSIGLIEDHEKFKRVQDSRAGHLAALPASGEADPTCAKNARVESVGTLLVLPGRENLAEAIDPTAFSNWQSLYDHNLEAEGPEFARRCADHWHLPKRLEALERADAVLALLAQLPATQSSDPHPHWLAGEKSGRHPQTVAEWDDRNDPTGQHLERAIRRLNVAADFDDPRAPDQMALVLRGDVTVLKHDWIHKNAYFEMKRVQREATVGQPRLTIAAGAIIDVMAGGKFDWRSRIDDSEFLESADWSQAMLYAEAALATEITS